MKVTLQLRLFSKQYFEFKEVSYDWHSWHIAKIIDLELIAVYGAQAESNTYKRANLGLKLELSTKKNYYQYSATFFLLAI